MIDLAALLSGYGIVQEAQWNAAVSHWRFVVHVNTISDCSQPFMIQIIDEIIVFGQVNSI